MRVDNASNSLIHEEPVNVIQRWEETAGTRGALEVVVGEEVEDGKGERIDAVLGVVGNLDVRESMLE